MRLSRFRRTAVGARTRIVLLSRDTSQEAMVSAARAGVAEVLGKPTDMARLLAQVHAHAQKRSGTACERSCAAGRRDSPRICRSVADDGRRFMGDARARGLLGSDRLNADLLREVMPDAVGLDEDPEGLVELVRKTMARLVEANEDGADPEAQAETARARCPRLDDLTKSATLGSGDAPSSEGRAGAMLDSGMQDALQRTDQIAMDVERPMDEVLDEAPPRVTDAPLEGAQHVDDETLAYVRLCVEEIRDLLWDLGRPGAVSVDPLDAVGGRHRFCRRSAQGSPERGRLVHRRFEARASWPSR